MDSKLKYLRWEERMVPGKKKPKKVAMVFLVPGPNAEKYPGKFICRAGPGLRPIPEDGQWYDYTVYLAKRLRCGDAAEGVPPDVLEKRAAKAKRDKNKDAK